VVVRNNIAKANVAGMEIENTQYADVYGNLAEDNTAGLAVFDLPGNPVIGRDIYVHDNKIIANNRLNFAPGGTVAQVPAGTGTFILASRRVEFANNIYEDNNTVDIAVLSGLAIEGKAKKWRLANDKLVGDTKGLELPSDATGVSNYRSSDVYIHHNSHKGGGTKPDNTNALDRPLGFLLFIVWLEAPVDAVVYDGWHESKFHATDAANNSNDNRVCVHDETNGSMVNLNLEVVLPKALNGKFPKLTELYRPKAPYVPYDCNEMKGGPIPKVSIKQLSK
jgi:parallel beta-helix repeat protein